MRADDYRNAIRTEEFAWRSLFVGAGIIGIFNGGMLVFIARLVMELGFLLGLIVVLLAVCIVGTRIKRIAAKNRPGMKWAWLGFALGTLDGIALFSNSISGS